MSTPKDRSDSERASAPVQPASPDDLNQPAINNGNGHDIRLCIAHERKRPANHQFRPSLYTNLETGSNKCYWTADTGCLFFIFDV